MEYGETCVCTWRWKYFKWHLTYVATWLWFLKICLERYGDISWQWNEARKWKRWVYFWPCSGQQEENVVMVNDTQLQHSSRGVGLPGLCPSPYQFCVCCIYALGDHCHSLAPWQSLPLSHGVKMQMKCWGYAWHLLKGSLYDQICTAFCICQLGVTMINLTILACALNMTNCYLFILMWKDTPLISQSLCMTRPPQIWFWHSGPCL